MLKIRGNDLTKKVGSLSGGEQVRLAIACCLLAQQPKELLLLDEPTNHMDLISVQCIEQALKSYTGAMIVISHDHDFLKNIEITHTLETTRGQLSILTTDP